jgi:hypothetical protein
MDDWVKTADLDLATVEPEVIEVGPLQSGAGSPGRAGSPL